MNSMKIAALAAAAMTLATVAHAGELLVNGNFETGDLSGWTVVDQAGGAGSWYIAGNGTGSPLNGFTTPTNPGGETTNARARTRRAGAAISWSSRSTASPAATTC